MTAPVFMLTGLCTLVYFLDGLVHTIMGPIAPELARALSLTPAQLGPIFSANLVGQCIGLVSAPLMADRYGHRLIVITTLLGFGIAQTLTGLASSAEALIAFRLVTGFFLGGCLPSCLALVTAAAPEARRGLAIMLLFTGYGLGATVAGIVPALFKGFGGWEAAMAGVGFLCLLSALAAALWLQDVEAPANEPSGSASVMTVLSRQYLVGTLALWLLFIGMLTVSYCLNSWLPILLVEVGRDESLASLSVSIFSLGGIIAALGVGVLIDRFGAMPVLIAALCVSTALLALVGQLLATASVGVLLLLLGASGFFVLGAYGGVNVVLASYYPARLRATGIGWTKSVSRLGTILAPILIGFGLSAGMSGTMIMSLFAVPAAVAVLALLVIARAARRRVEADARAGR